MIRVVGISFLAALFAPAIAIAQSEPPTPLVDGYVHTGVSSCSTAGCHGDQVDGPGAGPVVGQNEYFIWRSPEESGAHSRAYEVLLTPHGKRIGHNLGIASPEKSDICLDCHGDNVPESLRSQRFQMSDGVACEACHGGAQNWLAFHRIGAGHQQNIEEGLYPTEDPLARGRLCLSCHLGSSTKNQFISHRIMGAGHPRLKFELDLYTKTQQHHTIDDDYRARKNVAPGAQIWAIGQALSLQRTLELLIDSDVGMRGAFPEFAFFDCHACHQPISSGTKDLSWRPNPTRALGPGVPVLNDANLFMLMAAARVFDPALAQRLEQEARVMHAASQHSASQFRSAAETLSRTADETAERLLTVDFSDRATVRAILGEIVDASLAERYTNYAAAEQALFAVQRLTADLGMDNEVMREAILDASRHVQDPYTYNQSAFRASLAKIGEIMGL